MKLPGLARAIAACIAIALPTGASADPVPAPSLTYDSHAPLDLNIESTATQGNVKITDISYRSQAQIVEAQLVQPAANESGMPGVLFVRDLGDAQWLARRGVTSLIPDMPWTLPHWAESLRSYDTDARDTVASIVALRRSLDMLSGIDGVDKSHLLIVGHGLGATYVALTTGVDTRPIAGAFVAPELSLAKRLQAASSKPPADPAAYAASLAAFDTSGALARSSFGPSLMQFANRDPLVPKSDAAAFVDAVPGTHKTIDFYDTTHALVSDVATDDLRKWIAKELGVR